MDFSVDVNGSIYVANGSANHIIKYTPNGFGVVSLIGAGSLSPYTFQRMTVDGNGAVYTSEFRVCVKLFHVSNFPMLFTDIFCLIEKSFPFKVEHYE